MNLLATSADDITGILGVALTLCGAVIAIVWIIFPFLLLTKVGELVGHAERANQLAEISAAALQTNGAKLALILEATQANGIFLDTLNSRAERANTLLEWAADIASKKLQP